MTKLAEILKTIDNLVWGPPLLILLVGTGIYLTFSLGLIQITKLPLALKYLFSKDEKDFNEGEGDISSFKALCTALSATIGTGNIVGVATAIKLGGPGALFWMWMAAFFGMATKYSECMLSVKYRTFDENNNACGGPMFYIEKGVKGFFGSFLAKAFAFFGIMVAFFGIGTFAQVDSITTGLNGAFGLNKVLVGIILTILVAFVTLGGIQKISKAAELIVPFMTASYIIASLLILALNFSELSNAVSLVIKGAFTPIAATGGFLGSTMILAMRTGVSRGVFSNESGLGSAPIAAAAAKSKSHVKQGLISMTGTFFDTILVCTMTGLVLIITGFWSSTYEGASMTSMAFRTGMKIDLLGLLIVNVGLCFFAFTTILGWNYYGERCVVYLFGNKKVKFYKWIFIGLIAIGPYLELSTIWTLADIVNGLMAIPNLIGLIMLRDVIKVDTKNYFEKLKNVA
ncbi:sodium:alanine symporter family protein [Peptostreptococcaceae bacterium AGR-M142]